MAMAVESWDDDADFEVQGDMQPFNTSIGSTAQTSISSRLSVHSESLAGDDDWNVVIQPNDAQSTTQAIQSAKQAGIPLPSNVPSSALLGGTIKRLGKKKSTQKMKMDDDWDNDLDMGSAPLMLKPKAIPPPETPENMDDDFDDLEGSLGIRFAGTKRDGRERSASASGMSPSMGSATGPDTDEDEMKGLELPANLDFGAMLKKRQAAEAELSDLSQPSPAIEQPSTMNVHKKSKLLSDDNDDFLNDFDIGGPADMPLNIQKRTVNKNIKVKSLPKLMPPASRAATTLNFHDKPTDKPTHMRSHLPRPVSGSKPPPSRLEPVFESGASQIPSTRRQQNAIGNRTLSSKRSMPALRSQQATASSTLRDATRPPVPFLPAGATSSQHQHGSHYAAQQRALPYHARRDSDPNRLGAQSPPPRSQSRLSNAFVPDTPSRGARAGRRDLAPAALAREAASKRTVTKPARRREFGDGSELEIFDDLPTSSTKESKFIKNPVARGPPKLNSLRQVPSQTNLNRLSGARGIPDRMTTPAPPRTPASPTKGFQEFHQPTANTPSFMRDTAASRIARDSRLQRSERPRSEGPLMPLSTNWKAQVAARSPHTSPSAQRQKDTNKRIKPQLIKGIGSHVAKSK